MLTSFNSLGQDVGFSVIFMELHCLIGQVLENGGILGLVSSHIRTSSHSVIHQSASSVSEKRLAQFRHVVGRQDARHPGSSSPIPKITSSSVSSIPLQALHQLNFTRDMGHSAHQSMTNPIQRQWHQLPTQTTRPIARPEPVDQDTVAVIANSGN